MRGTTDGLRFGPVSDGAVHLCVDMQRLFADDTPWHTPSMARILPKVERIARAHAERTIFTRFIPAQNAASAVGTWRRYYEHWSSVTLDALPPGTLDLLPSLAPWAPPARLFDKTTYGPWLDGRLDALLKARGTTTLVITGGETDVCVLGTVVGAVDLGYRAILVADALCSASDDTHEAMMEIYGSRYDRQIEIVSTEALLDAWH